MIVMKFGGTSVGHPDRIRTVFELVKRARAKKSIIVVASAHGGVTNMLLKAGEPGEKGNKTYNEIVQRHKDILAGLDLPPTLLDEELKELKDLLRGIHLVKELTPRTRDYLMSFGERMSCKSLAAFFTAQGLPTKAHNAYDIGFITDSNFGDATLLPEQEEEINRCLQNQDELPLVTGFVAKNRQGDITTLGRSGSDTTAAIVGGAIRAEEIQIWTDVDGIMTADPSFIKEARSIPSMTFDEAAELAYFGAKVLHPDCIWPAVKHNIPVRVLNTYHPEHPGTVITQSLEADAPPVRAIAYKEDQILFNIVSRRMLMHHGFMARVFDIFDRFRLAVDMIATTEVSVSLTINTPDVVEDVVKELSHFSEVTVQKNHAIVCVVGSKIRDTPGIPGIVFDTLRKTNVSVDMISVGASKVNVSFVVDNEQIDPAVRALHKVLFEN